MRITKPPNVFCNSASLSHFLFQGMYSLSMSEMRSMNNRPVLKSQRFILRGKVNLRKIREPKEAEPFFLPSSWMLLLNQALDCRLCSFITDLGSKLESPGQFGETHGLVSRAHRDAVAQMSHSLFAFPEPWASWSQHSSAPPAVLGCAELEQRLEHL